jgi:hypothetical protein
MSSRLAQLSEWIDSAPANIGRNPEALTWHRVMKVAEEIGEVTEAMIGWTAGNPRKGETHESSDVVKELLDVAVSALAGVEHLTGNGGLSMAMLEHHIDFLMERAKLSPATDPNVTEPLPHGRVSVWLGDATPPRWEIWGTGLVLGDNAGEVGNAPE